MPEFALELTAPDTTPEAGSKTRFFWTAGPGSSFESDYEPHLLGLGPVAPLNVDLVGSLRRSLRLTGQLAEGGVSLTGAADRSGWRYR